jgi:uncharacterized protein YndB with AHSA1/START domain
VTVISVVKDFERLIITLVADFDAPIERVWRLWADRRQLERWWGPPGYPATELVRMGAVEGLRAAVGQIDAVLAG